MFQKVSALFIHFLWSHQKSRIVLTVPFLISSFTSFDRSFGQIKSYFCGTMRWKIDQTSRRAILSFCSMRPTSKKIGDPWTFRNQIFYVVPLLHLTKIIGHRSEQFSTTCHQRRDSKRVHKRSFSADLSLAGLFQKNLRGPLAFVTRSHFSSIVWLTFRLQIAVVKQTAKREKIVWTRASSPPLKTVNYCIGCIFKNVTNASI